MLSGEAAAQISTNLAPAFTLKQSSLSWIMYVRSTGRSEIDQKRQKPAFSIGLSQKLLREFC